MDKKDTYFCVGILLLVGLITLAIGVIISINSSYEWTTKTINEIELLPYSYNDNGTPNYYAKELSYSISGQRYYSDGYLVRINIDGEVVDFRIPGQCANITKNSTQIVLKEQQKGRVLKGEIFDDLVRKTDPNITWEICVP